MAEEDWFWGNHRGGGGAPVMTDTGKQVSNLRDVARGKVQVDQLSPSARHMRERNHDQRNDYDRDRDRDRDRNYRDTEDGRERRSRHSSYDEYDKPSHHDNPTATSTFVSPSNRGARKNMFVSDSDREQKARKAREYQESLRVQVEEKRQQKEAAERDKRNLKKQEYDEYISHHYKGKIPAEHINGHHNSPAKGGRGRVQNSPPRSYADENNYYSNGRREQATPPRNGHREQATPPRNGRREQATPPRNGRREQATPPRNGRREQATPPRNGRIHDNHRDFDNGGRVREDHGVISPITSAAHRKQRVYNDNDGDRGRGNDDRDGWVSKVEYEELSTLCKGLLQQQKALEKQLEEQNHLIQNLQAGSGGGVRGSKLGAKRGPRARGGVAGGGVGGRDVGAKGPRITNPDPGEKKPTARQAAALAAAEKRKQPKVSVGFGSRIETVKEKEKRERFAANALRSQSHSGSRQNKSLVPEGSPNSHQQRPKSMKAKGEVGRGGGGGFKQLQAQVGGGPRVVTYDDEDNAGGGVKRVSPDKFRRSQGELRGASDLMYIEGSDVDRISEDQLDKLLGKARGARS